MMRRPEYEMSREAAIAFLKDAPAVHVASVGRAGQPILRTVNAVVVDGAIAFHGAPAGEKTELAGQPAVVSAEEIVATLPSYFVDPRRACPATTLYTSVQVHGTLERLDDPEAKARVLQALMEKHQPEGGHVPVTAADPLYNAVVAGLLVMRLPLEHVTGKAKLAQNRSAAEVERILTGLWRRGEPGDPRALERIRMAHPGLAGPDFLRGPDGATLHVWLPPTAAPAAAELVAGAYWNVGLPRERLERAHRSACAWVGARDGEGRLIATARAISDGGKFAWVYDVMVAPDWRGRGLGRRLVELLLEHPAVRGVRSVHLSTRDAQGVYAPLGFLDRATLPPKPYPSTEMVLRRDQAPCVAK